MEWSKGINTDKISRKERVRIANVRSVLCGLTARYTGTPFPAMSEHFRLPIPSLIPGAIGAVAIDTSALEGRIKTQMNRWEDEAYHPGQTIIEDAGFGFDSEGNYHMPSLRTEHVVDL